MSDDLRTRIMAVLRDLGWTCEYHEPVSALGECKQCDKSHGSTADAVIRELGPVTPTITMWFCTFCRSDVQAGAKPDTCLDCKTGECLQPFEVPYVNEDYRKSE